MIRVNDIFCGFGGFAIGAELTGRVRVQFGGNHEPTACEWFGRNHPGAVVECQDLNQFNFHRMPYAEILLAAPACQGGSSAGQPARAGTGGSHNPDRYRVQKQHDADRATALAVISAVEATRPRVVVVENTNLFDWELYSHWRGMLETMGYRIAEHRLNASDFGSPQDRTRQIVTAALDQVIEIVSTRDRARSLLDVLHPDDHPDNIWHPIASKPERMRVRIAKAQREAGPRCFWNNVSESRGRPLDGLSPTATTQSGTQFCLVDGERIKVLSPREMGRIQSVPDSCELPRNRRLASKLIGNMIDVSMARGIVEQVAEAL